MPPGPNRTGAGKAKRLASHSASSCFEKGFTMTRSSFFSSPFLLGFDDIERLLDQVTKSAGNGYPPYNVERLTAAEGGDRLRITLAVAGFAAEELELTVEDNQLIVRGNHKDDGDRRFLHRGIAARQFHRAFVLADGMEVTGATLENGLLAIDLERPEPQRTLRRIDIRVA